MANLLTGIIVIIVCSFGYFLAWKARCKGKTRNALFFMLLCGLILRIYSSSDLYLHTWDEKYHALVAKHMIDHPFQPTLWEHPALPYNFKDWTGNHIWLHKQPLPLWTMALSMWIFGINEGALRFPSILLSTIGIFLTFSIGRRLFNKEVGLLAAFLFSIHGLIVELTGGRVATDHFDIFFLFFIELAIWLAFRFSEKKNIFFNLLCGISIGSAILTKWLPALIVLPVWLLVVNDSGKFSRKEIILQFAMLCLVVLVVVLPWQIYIRSTFPMEYQWESSMNLKHLTQVVEDRGGPFYYHLDHIRIQYGELVYLPLIWFFWKSIKRVKNKKRLILAIWILIPVIFYSIIATKMQAYTVITAPAIFIITALFCNYLFHYRKQFRYKPIIYIVILLLLFLPVRYSIERLKPFSSVERNPAWVKKLKLLNKRRDPPGT